MDEKKDLEIVKSHIASFPDFPKPGILFRDMFPIMRSPTAMTALQNLLVNHVKNNVREVDVIVALESRGFLLAPLISVALGLPLVPVRKKGKLPGKTKSVEYSLEYGSDSFEMQESSLQPGQKVIIVDDLLATGGTATAACELIKDMGGDVLQLLVLMELKDLKGRGKVPCPAHALVEF